MTTPTLLIALLLLSPLLAACASSHAVAPPPVRGPDWAIAIHAGAGAPDRNAPKEEIDSYRRSLESALRLGVDELAAGGTSLDAVEKVVRFLEDDPQFNAGRGAVYTADGTHELDASIMDGRTLACGAVAGVRTVKNPISLARLVMEKSRHVFLACDGAERFADEMGVERVDPSYFDTPKRYEALQRVLEERRKGNAAKQQSSKAANDQSDDSASDPNAHKGTVGAVALDVHGNLAAATSTGGLTAKQFGRIGDTPIIGAGTYADNKSAAVSCTGVGEEFIRHTVARDIAALIEYRGLPAERAARYVVFDKLRPDDGGVIVVSYAGEIAMVYSTDGMFRGAADSTGRFEVAIWEDEQ